MLPEHFACIGKSLMDVDACAFDRTGDDDRRDDNGGCNDDFADQVLIFLHFSSFFWSGIQFSSSSGVNTASFGGAETGAEDGARLSERSNVSVP